MKRKKKIMINLKIWILKINKVLGNLKKYYYLELILKKLKKEEGKENLFKKINLFLLFPNLIWISPSVRKYNSNILNKNKINNNNINHQFLRSSSLKNEQKKENKVSNLITPIKDNSISENISKFLSVNLSNSKNKISEKNIFNNNNNNIDNSNENIIDTGNNLISNNNNEIFDNQIINNIKAKYNSLIVNNNLINNEENDKEIQEIFDDALKYCYEKLAEKFIEFRKTNSFQNLYEELAYNSYIQCKMSNTGLLNKF